MRLVIMGLPGSGKSTITAALTARSPLVSSFGVRRFFNEHVEAGTPLGQQASSFVKAQAWIPDRLVVQAFLGELRSGRLQPRFVIEGMPANLPQAQLLSVGLDTLSAPLDAALFVDVPSAECRRRAARRIVCFRCDGGAHPAVTTSRGKCAICGHDVSRRPNDTGDAFESRLAQQAPLIEPVLEFYREQKILHRIDGLASPKAVLHAVDDALGVSEV